MKPVLQALVLAERVYEDRSGKKIIAGTFNGITIHKFAPKPFKKADGSNGGFVLGDEHCGEMGSPWAYVSLTDVVEGTVLRMEVVNVGKNKVVLSKEVTIQAKDRLATIEIVLALPSLRAFLHEPGTYSFDAVWKGEVLGSHRIVVDAKEEPSPSPGAEI